MMGYILKLLVFFFLGGFILLFIGSKVYSLIQLPDNQCARNNNLNFNPPEIQDPKLPNEFFELGNYFYDVGNCNEALINYSQAIDLDPEFSRAYNNRAYTNMRLRNYEDALSDLNTAISLDPNYSNALMNRGDIYNYYYAINREKAIEDYNKVISLGIPQGSSVCSHKAMAETYNILPLALLKSFTYSDCKNNL